MRCTSWLAVLVAASACAVGPAVSIVRVGPGEKSADVSGDPIKVRHLEAEPFDGAAGGFHVIRTAEEWKHAWPAGQDAPLPRDLDLARSTLFLAVAESREIVEVRIQRVFETAGHVHVWVRTARAGRGCSASPADSTPLDAAVVPRQAKPVRFHVEEEPAETCGDAPAVTVRCHPDEAREWKTQVDARAGETIDCEMAATVRGRFALIDSSLSLGALPKGSAAKLTYGKSSSRGSFTIDVLGSYTVQAEAIDEGHRRSVATATVDAMPPKSRDVLVQLVWSNFDASDDPTTFPRVELRATKPSDPRRRCSIEAPLPELCAIETSGANARMTLRASDKRVPIEVRYVDERAAKGPLVCVQLFFDGARTVEACDDKPRGADARWSIGTVDMTNGTLVASGTPSK